MICTLLLQLQNMENKTNRCGGNIKNDLLIKFAPIGNISPYNQPELQEIRLIISNNNIKNNKSYIPLLNICMGITGQYPKLLKSGVSIASFRLRKGNLIGLLTTLRKTNLSNFLTLLNTNILPKIFSNTTLASQKVPSSPTLSYRERSSAHSLRAANQLPFSNN